MPPGLEDFSIDPGLMERLSGEGPLVIMVVGGIDTGKTTLVEVLSDYLSKRAPTGVVDLDMGQSHIGPPSTVAWAAVDGGFRGWEGMEARDIYFTGALSPPGSLLPALAGAKVVTEKAGKACSRVVVDTTGLIDEPCGRVLKQYKIDVISPDMVIALERRGELSHILAPFRFNKRPRVFNIAPLPGARGKGPEQRAEYRASRFREYFKGSRIVEVSMESSGVRFTGDAPAEGLTGRLISFRDASNADLAVGMIERADHKGKKIFARTPLKDAGRITSVVIGRAAVTVQAGQEGTGSTAWD